MRPQWEIDAIDQLEEYREQRAARRRWEALPPAAREQMIRGNAPKVKFGLGGRRRRARRNRRALIIRWLPVPLVPSEIHEFSRWLDEQAHQAWSRLFLPSLPGSR